MPNKIFEQYKAAKSKYTKHLCLFKVGDFYQLYYDDAKLISKALGLTLTSAGGKGKDLIPMAGIPIHSSEAYIARVLKQGISVAICEV